MKAIQHLGRVSVLVMVLGTSACAVVYGSAEIDLEHAVQSGDSQKVAYAISRGAGVNKPKSSSSGYATPLVISAASGGHQKVVGQLLDAGANVNIRGRGDETALHVASAGGHLNVVKLLLERGGEVDAADSQGRTPLHWVVGGNRQGRLLGLFGNNNDKEIAQLLIASGADVSRQDAQGSSPMKEMAAKYGADAARAMLSQGGARVPEVAPRQGIAPSTFSFRRVPPRSEDVAVIIGNWDYGALAKDIPQVPPAANDAVAMKRFAIEALGVRESNVIWLPNATGSQIVEVFGNERDHRGRLFNWTTAGRSKVFVYYSGHGAPVGPDGKAVIVPSDVSASQLPLSGYPLDLLYGNLAKLPAESVTVVLEACFSGLSPAGTVIPKASPVSISPKMPQVPPNMTVITAGAANQIASWEQDGSHGLFTKHFLLGYGGEADRRPFGDGNGDVQMEELRRYLEDKVGTLARRYYGREQTVQIVKGASR